VPTFALTRFFSQAHIKQRNMSEKPLTRLHSLNSNLANPGESESLIGPHVDLTVEIQ
jgi:hypothetical protein